VVKWKRKFEVNPKLPNLLLIIFSLFGYLEWGQGQHAFLFQAEAELFSKFLSDPADVIHPLTVLPFLGQVLLLVTLFQKTPSKILTYLGIAGLGLLFGMMVLAGIFGGNMKIILSTLPFLGTAAWVVWRNRKSRIHHQEAE
jgi:hypothetical protein